MLPGVEPRSNGMSERGVACTWMRAGTSKGAFLLEADLPVAKSERDALRLSVMGSPDVRQIDGIGGGDPLASKVAVVSRSNCPGVDVDYLFLQVAVDDPIVSDDQNCGNMLAGVGPFATERSLVAVGGDETPVSIHIVNTEQVAVATVSKPGGRVSYAGTERIDGVPRTAAAVPLEFRDVAGSSCGTLLPTGRAVDELAGVPCTMIENGMPCVVIKAEDLGVTGYEDRDALDADVALKARIERIRLLAGPMMNLGDVSAKLVPKMMLVAPPRNGGAVTVRSFIPHRAHAAIGVVGRGQRHDGLPVDRIARRGCGEHAGGIHQDALHRAPDR